MPEGTVGDAVRITARLRHAYLLLAGVTTVVLVGVWISAPSLADALTREDQELETAQALFFFVGAMFGFAGLGRRPSGFDRLVYASIPVLSLLAFLDEISYGERIFGWRPTTLWGYEFDAIHDLFKIGLCLWRDHGGPVVDMLVSVVLGGSTIAAFLWRRAYMPRIMSLIRTNPAFDYVRFAVIMIAVAQLLDVRVLDSTNSDFIEELLEFQGALALFFASGCMLIREERADCIR